MMKLFCKRTYCTSPSSTIGSRIIESCRSLSLASALTLLNSTSSTQLSRKPIVYASLLHTSTKLESFIHGVQFHSHVIKSGLETDRFVGNNLLALYFKLCSNFLETRKVFDGLFFKDVVSWSSMISGHIRTGDSMNGIRLFLDMLDFGVEPNGFTVSALIKACTELGDLKLGRCFHGIVFTRGFDMNNVISSSLVDMYAKNYQLNDARQVFDELYEPDSVSWTTIISAYTRNDMFQEALSFFFTMQKDYGLPADVFTYGSVLTACGNLVRVGQAKQVHTRIITSGFSGNVVVESSLVDAYAKCGLMPNSQLVFDRMVKKNSVSWCALLGGYSQNGEYDIVLEVFREMDIVDLYSFGTVIRACAGLTAVRQGKEIHCQYLKKGGWRNVIVESALVDLYAKCGCIDFAYRVFKEMSERNLISWNSMICGFAQNGRGTEAINMFNEMINVKIKPDYISFVGVLFACSHTGLVQQGREYFKLMTEIKPGIELYSCMVDLLGRAGLIEEAEILILNGEFVNDSSLWASLLGACTTSTDSTVAERIAKKMMELKPDYHLSYVLLGQMYRAVGRWSDALKIWRLMRDRGVQKTPGKSWIELGKSPLLASLSL